MPRRVLPLLLAALLPACSTPGELTGAAAARSRGGSVEEGPAGEAPGVAPEPVDSFLDDAEALARVNGQVITRREVRHDLGRAYEEWLHDREALARLVDQQVQRILLRRIVVAEARRIGITATDDDLREETERIEREAAAAGDTLDQMLRDTRMTRREWDERTKDDIVLQRSRWYFLGQFPASSYDPDGFRPAVDTFVRPEEVRAFGAAHAAALGIRVPPRATLRVIDLRVESFRGPGIPEEDAWRACETAAAGAEQRLREGASFADLAKEISGGPEAKDGGLFGPVYADSAVRAEYRDWALREGRADGDLSPRIRIPTGFLLLRMEKREEERSRPIEEWAPEARAQLLGLKRAIAWNEVQIGLLEEACVEPAALKASVLGQLRASVRKMREELPAAGPASAAANR